MGAVSSAFMLGVDLRGQSLLASGLQLLPHRCIALRTFCLFGLAPGLAASRGLYSINSSDCLAHCPRMSLKPLRSQVLHQARNRVSSIPSSL